MFDGAAVGGLTVAEGESAVSARDQERWDSKYAAMSADRAPPPDAWLVEQAAPLRPGRALELACGMGQNAIWLAGQGWQVEAVDISPVAVNLARQQAEPLGLHADWIAADLDEYVPAPGVYDLVCVFRFLDRDRLPARIIASLASGGRLIYETFTHAQLDRPESHLKNPTFALRPGELPRLFAGLRVISYAECELADRSVARLVAEAP